MLTLALSLHGEAIDESSFGSDATLINFDDLTGGGCNLCGPPVTNQYAGLGVTFLNPSLPGEDTADTNLVPFIPNFSPPNALFVEQGGSIGQPPVQPFEILFSVPVMMVGFDYGSSGDSFIQLDAYSADNQLLQSLIFTGSPAPIGSAGFAGLEEPTAIARLDVSYHPNVDPTRTFNFSIDNLRFQPAPEPPSVVLISTALLAGLRFLKRRL